LVLPSTDGLASEKGLSGTAAVADILPAYSLSFVF
jgi:hypothetical protein